MSLGYSVIITLIGQKNSMNSLARNRDFLYVNFILFFKDKDKRIKVVHKIRSKGLKVKKS